MWSLYYRMCSLYYRMCSHNAHTSTHSVAKLRGHFQCVLFTTECVRFIQNKDCIQNVFSLLQIVFSHSVAKPRGLFLCSLYYRMCSLDIECVLLSHTVSPTWEDFFSLPVHVEEGCSLMLEVFSYYRMCSLYYRMCSLYYRMCSLTFVTCIKIVSGQDGFCQPAQMLVLCHR